IETSNEMYRLFLTDLVNRKEFELLKFLVTQKGKVFSRDAILDRVWGYEYYGGTRTVDVHIRRIRAKLGPVHGDYVQTIRNVGYIFRDDL
ncbi:MAG: winged helix-turn-helix domain-containing protein, partial [Candidatus Tectomicrobia bacterium]|nr:winged helix-turn-helix domain-containing protein [Candidatus Tectomicrobia bacterium]